MEHVRRSVLRDDSSTDGHLLLRFIENRDEAAFAALVRRHGTMVWGVCCRLLDQHDAEDAFQATFLILVRKAASIVPREKVANWLYGVAHQTALHARRTMARRRTRERQVVELAEPAVAAPDVARDVQLVLDQELSRLPAFHREVVVLSDLEGKSRREVAQQLGVPEGTVASRLARARAMLAKRLTKRGITLSVAALATVLAQAASAGVPSRVQEATINAARLLAAGQAASSGVAALTEGVMHGMLFTKLKAVLAVVMMLSFWATGVTLLTNRMAAAQVAENSPNQKDEKKGIPDPDGFTAWGKEVGGLQAGLSISNRNDVHIGGTVTAVVILRNVSNRAITASVWPLWFPQVDDMHGKRVRATRSPEPDFEIILTKIALQPSQTVALGKSTIFVVGSGEADQPVPEGVVDHFTIYVPPGTYKAVFGGFVQEHPLLATGTVEFKVMDAKDAKKERTAWGNEVGGLQAGLGFRLGDHGFTTTARRSRWSSGFATSARRP
jgi:RNA polymerase sigma factor (sigma-70 family)